jgi:starvation-inducible outer membrane lipoprotein
VPTTLPVAAAALVAALALAGCSTPPTTLSNPRGSIMLQWQDGKTSQSTVRTLAERHCESWGKRAVSGGVETKNDTRVESFRCE